MEFHAVLYLFFLFLRQNTSYNRMCKYAYSTTGFSLEEAHKNKNFVADTSIIKNNNNTYNNRVG